MEKKNSWVNNHLGFVPLQCNSYQFNTFQGDTCFDYKIIWHIRWLMIFSRKILMTIELVMTHLSVCIINPEKKRMWNYWDETALSPIKMKSNFIWIALIEKNWRIRILQRSQKTALCAFGTHWKIDLVSSIPSLVLCKFFFFFLAFSR